MFLQAKESIDCNERTQRLKQQILIQEKRKNPIFNKTTESQQLIQTRFPYYKKVCDEDQQIENCNERKGNRAETNHLSKQNTQLYASLWNENVVNDQGATSFSLNNTNQPYYLFYL